MRKSITVAVLLCLLSAAFTSAERKTLPTTAELFSMAANGVVALSAVNPNNASDSYYLTGTIVAGETDKVTVATSLEAVVLGYTDIRLNSDQGELATKLKKIRYSFDYNLAFVDYEISKGNSKYYGPYGGRALPVSDSTPEVGQEVYVVRATPGGIAPHSVLPVKLSSTLSSKGRSYNLYSIDSRLAGGVLASLIGSPVLNRAGELIGVLNLDIDPNVSGKSVYSETYLETVFVHPAKGFLVNKTANDAFPKQTGPQVAQSITNHWLPVRLGPITQGWREFADLPPATKGVVVTNIYPEGSGCGLKIGDIITSIEGSEVSGLSWGQTNSLSMLFLRLLPKKREGSTWSVDLTVYRDGEQINVSASMPTLSVTVFETYRSDKLGIEFVEINDFSRYINDFPNSISGVFASRVAGNTLTIAVLRGMLGSVIKEVNGRVINKVSDLKEAVEGSGAGTLRFLVLDINDFQNKYITLQL